MLVQTICKQHVTCTRIFGQAHKLLTCEEMMLPDSIANNGFKKQKQKLYVLLIHTLIFGRVMYLLVFASECFS